MQTNDKRISFLYENLVLTFKNRYVPQDFVKTLRINLLCLSVNTGSVGL